MCVHPLSALDWGSATVTVSGRSATMRIGCKDCGAKITKECNSGNLHDDAGALHDLSRRSVSLVPSVR